MIRLGVRLALSGGRTSGIAILITTLAVAAGTAVMLLALSFVPALEARYGRSAWRNALWEGEYRPPTPQDLLITSVEDHFTGLPLTRIEVAALGPDAPVPPGIQAWPATGQALVSPALGRLLLVTPPDELANRLGAVVGTIGEEALRSPNELAVVQGESAEDLERVGAAQVSQLQTDSDLPKFELYIALLAAIAAAGALTPIAVFIATATRLTAATRERRLALLRLVGATQAQMSRIAVGETAVAMVPGALLGIALFFLVRPLVATIQVDQADWFVDAIAPPLWQGIAAVVVIPLLGVGAALLGLRRAMVSPLGMVRQQRPSRPGWRRIVPLAIAAAVFLVGLGNLSKPDERGPFDIPVVAVAFLGMIVGVAVAGPLLTAWIGLAIGRLSRGASLLMAGRRLADAPSGTFGAVSGVVMVAFVASTFSVVLSYASTIAGDSLALPYREGSLEAWIGPTSLSLTANSGGGDQGATVRLIQDLEALPGARAVAAIGEGDITIGDPNGDNATYLPTWVTECAPLNAALDISLDCFDGQAWVHYRTTVQNDQRAQFQQWTVIGRDAENPIYPQPIPLDQIEAGGPMIMPNGGPSGIPDVVVDPSAFPVGSDVRLSRLIVVGDGSASFNEGARTLIEAALPNALVSTLAEIRSGTASTLHELARIVALGTLATLLVAGCSLAVSMAAGLLDRRRPLALLRLVGMPLGRLRLALFLEVAIPLVFAALLSAVLGVWAGIQMLQAAARVTIAGPDPSLLLVLGAGIGLALVVALATLPLVGRVTSTESTRFE